MDRVYKLNLSPRLHVFLNKGIFDRRLNSNNCNFQLSVESDSYLFKRCITTGFNNCSSPNTIVSTQVSHNGQRQSSR